MLGTSALAALEIAPQYGSHLHMIHEVRSEGYGVTGVRMLSTVNLSRHNAKDLESEISQKGYLEGIRYQISIENGEVWPVVSLLAEEEDVDLAVVATRGGGGLGISFWHR